MAAWAIPRWRSLIPSTWTTATGMPTMRAADSTRLNRDSTAITRRNTGFSRRTNRQLSPRSRPTVASTPPAAGRGAWGMRMNSSITADRKKQPTLTHRMGRMPKAPKSTPPITGPSRLDRVPTMLITALALVSRSGPASRGMLAWTAGW